MAKWGWVGKVAQFWNRTVGRLVPRLQVQSWTNQSIDLSPAQSWAADLAEGRLSVQSWQQQMRQEIKREYIRQYLAGKGGIEQMTAKDWGSIGGAVGEQYKYLDRFAQEIADGNLTEGQIRVRSGMYVNSAREAFERAKERAATEAGFTEVRWVLNVAEHCQDCIDLSNLGWQRAKPWPFKVGGRAARPGSGATRCKTNCKCSTDYR